MQTYIDNSFYQIGKDDKELISITINITLLFYFFILISFLIDLIMISKIIFCALLHSWFTQLRF